MGERNERLEAARRYLARGWSVLPVLPGRKRPARWVGSWADYRDRLPSEQEIHEWWSRNPHAVVGLVTGELSGVVVVDVDVDEDLEPVEERVRALLEDAPTGLLAKTPSGGAHLFYRHPGWPVKTYADQENGIDVRGDGGFVVLPPAEGRTWLNVEDVR